MFSLYYQPFSCSLAVHAALEKIGKPFELIKVNLTSGEQFSEGHLSLNPQAQVPVLIFNGNTITQAGAILVRLSEQFQDFHLMPSLESKERDLALQSLFFLSNTLHPAFSILFYPERISKESTKEVKEMSLERAKGLLDQIDKQLSHTNYLTGDKVYAPDYYLFSILNWLRLFNINLNSFINLKSYFKKLKLLPEIQRAMLTESRNI